MISSRLFSVMIVDDEVPARTLLETYVSRVPELEVVASCSNALEASRLLSQIKVDILLCDIQMPGLNGLDFVRALEKRPAVIFTTAYAQYAINGFELDAVDYLLKPIALPRFIKAVNKAMEQLSSSIVEEEYLNVKADYKIYRIALQELLFIESQHEYVTYHTISAKITAYGSLKSLERDLPAGRFLRIHKSYIVAIDKIGKMNQTSVTVRDLANHQLPVGRVYRDSLKSLYSGTRPKSHTLGD